jgi:RNA polymerase sigma-70 factor, ECF subfamily
VAFNKANLHQVKGRRSRREPSATLMSLITKGDESACQLFKEATSGLLYAILLHILGHTQIAEEVLLELYDEVKRQPVLSSTFKESPLTWLILIAHRRAVERLCHQNGSQKGNVTESSTSNESFINISEHRRLIRETLESIPEVQREMMELAFFSGMNTREIAMELDESQEVVEEGLRSGALRFFCTFRSLPLSVIQQN